MDRDLNYWLTIDPEMWPHTPPLHLYRDMLLKGFDSLTMRQVDMKNLLEEAVDELVHAGML